MAKDSSNNKVIDALNGTYGPLLTGFEQFHRQEHRFKKKYGYDKLAGKFDKLVHNSRGWRRKVLNRVERLGGDIDSKMGDVKVADDIKTAFKNTLDHLGKVYDSLGDAVTVAQSANDHPTHKMLMGMQDHVGKKIHQWEARDRQLSDLKENYPLTAI